MLEEAKYQPPLHGELVGKALDYLKNIHPKAWREMSKEERQEYAERKAIRAEDYTQRLIKSGTWEGKAWNRAIRLEILESESE